LSDPTKSSFVTKLEDVANGSSLWLLFALVGGSGASLMALGMLLRSNQALTYRMVMGTFLHSLMWGAAVFMVTYGYADLSLQFVLGLSILSGLGAASLVDIVLLIIRQRLGIAITISPPARTGKTEPAQLSRPPDTRTL
jgi:hypothetical protein